MRKRTRNILIFLLSMIIAAVIGMKLLVPLWLFQRFVIDPIPPSVKNIRTDTFLDIGLHKYVIGFEINKEDIPLILNSDEFKEINYVSYNKGILTYGQHWDDAQSHSSKTHGFHLYETYRGKYPPQWFRFDQWGNFKAYVAEDERVDFYGMRLLLYNEELDQAYFIDYEIRGSGVGEPTPTKEEMQREWKEELRKEGEINEKRHDEPNLTSRKSSPFIN